MGDLADQKLRDEIDNLGKEVLLSREQKLRKDETITRLAADNQRLRDENIDLRNTIANQGRSTEALAEGLSRALRSGTGTFAMLRHANVERSSQWHLGNEGFDAMFFAVATGGECGEALNVQKKLRRQELNAAGPTNIKPSRATLNDLADEMADTVIYMDLWAEKVGVDLWEAIVHKFNKKSDEMGFSVRLKL